MLETGLKNSKTKSLTQKQKTSYKKKLYGDRGGVCPICEDFLELKFFEVNHIHPISKGGDNSIENLELLCRSCNSAEGNKTMAEALASARHLLAGKPW